MHRKHGRQLPQYDVGCSGHCPDGVWRALKPDHQQQAGRARPVDTLRRCKGLLDTPEETTVTVT